MGNSRNLSEFSQPKRENSERFIVLRACFDAHLSDDEKTLLKGMMGDLNTKDKSKRGSKLDKLLSWLAGKGTDVFIAAMPYIVQRERQR